MKGRNTFSKAEADRICELLKELRIEPKRNPKTIRNKLRSIGFYLSDWGISNLMDFENLQKGGQIKIIQSKKYIPESTQIYNTLSQPIKNVVTPTNLKFKTIDNLKLIGFDGFISVSDLWKDHSVIPNIKGVYMVVRAADTAPKFLPKGTGGFYKGKDPNVPLDLLRANWVNDTCVVYIGQAGGIKNGKQPQSTLRSRLKQYLRFGQGQPIGHQGGCYIWQLKDVANLLFCWKPLPVDDPRTVEASLISSFKKCYGGQRPFANRND